MAWPFHGLIIHLLKDIFVAVWAFKNYWGSSREPQVRKKAEHKGLGEGDLEKLWAHLPCSDLTLNSTERRQCSECPVGTPLVIQWLRLLTTNAGGLDSVPGPGTRSCMLRPGTAKKKKYTGGSSSTPQPSTDRTLTPREGMCGAHHRSEIGSASVLLP